MSILNNLEKRLNTSNDNFQTYNDHFPSLQKMQSRLNIRGGLDQWTRMREDKLKSLKKALLYSYQKAIVQRYDVKRDKKIRNIISIITKLQDNQILSESENSFLDILEQDYVALVDIDRDSIDYINQLQNVINNITEQEPLFRCLINHDKLKVDYQDKIISIPFLEPPVGETIPVETNFHNGTVFKWVHGNKEEWTPDTYWIVYMQYSEETAYFRAEIRKADQEIEIVTIDNEGNETTAMYRGWMTGPNETTALWRTKKNVTWNDMNYTKLLYITKDEDTLAFFQRFDRIIINGKPWQVQAYNENYSTNKSAGVDSGIIRVALKETYTSTEQFVKEKLEAAAAAKEAKAQYDIEHTQTHIDGPTSARPYEILTFTAKNFVDEIDDQGRVIKKYWSLYGTNLARIVQTSVDGKTVTVEILTGTSNKQGFYINYGDSEDTMLNVKIVSL